MADNVTITQGAGTTVATRDRSGVHHPVGVGQGGALTDRSGDIAVAATSEEVAAANAARIYLLVQNVSESEDMWVDFGTAAVPDQPSVLLPPGGGAIVFENAFVPTGTVNIFCAASGEPYTAKEA